MRPARLKQAEKIFGRNPNTLAPSQDTVPQHGSVRHDLETVTSVDAENSTSSRGHVCQQLSTGLMNLPLCEPEWTFVKPIPYDQFGDNIQCFTRGNWGSYAADHHLIKKFTKTLEHLDSFPHSRPVKLLKTEVPAWRTHWTMAFVPNILESGWMIVNKLSRHSDFGPKDTDILQFWWPVKDGTKAQLLWIIRLMRYQGELVDTTNIRVGDEEHKTFYELCLRALRKDEEAASGELMTMTLLNGGFDKELDDPTPNRSGKGRPKLRNPTGSKPAQRDRTVGTLRFDLVVSGLEPASDLGDDIARLGRLDKLTASKGLHLDTKIPPATEFTPLSSLPRKRFDRVYPSFNRPTKVSSSSLNDGSRYHESVETSIEDTAQSPTDSEIPYREPRGVCLHINHDPEICSKDLEEILRTISGRATVYRASSIPENPTPPSRINSSIVSKQRTWYDSYNDEAEAEISEEMRRIPSSSPGTREVSKTHISHASTRTDISSGEVGSGRSSLGDTTAGTKRSGSEELEDTALKAASTPFEQHDGDDSQS